MSLKKRNAMAKKAIIKQAPADVTGGDLHEILNKSTDEDVKNALLCILNYATQKNKNLSISGKKIMRPDEHSAMVLMFTGLLLNYC